MLGYELIEKSILPTLALQAHVRPPSCHIARKTLLQKKILLNYLTVSLLTDIKLKVSHQIHWF